MLDVAYELGRAAAFADLCGLSREKVANDWFAETRLGDLGAGHVPVAGPSILGAIRGARDEDMFGGLSRGVVGGELGAGLGTLGGMAAIPAGGALYGAGSAALHNLQRSRKGPLGRLFSRDQDIGEEALEAAQHYAQDPRYMAGGAMAGNILGRAAGTRAGTSRYIDKTSSLIDHALLQKTAISSENLKFLGLLGGSATIPGALTGAAYGAATGDDAESRLRRGLGYGALGAGVGGLLGAPPGALAGATLGAKMTPAGVEAGEIVGNAFVSGLLGAGVGSAGAGLGGAYLADKYAK